MSGSSFGKYFTVTTFGESHGIGLGAIVDGCPAGLSINEELIQHYLDLRKPGQTKYSTPRKEGDKIRILSGIMDGKTTGTPIMLLSENENQRSADYSEIASYYRPGHADFTFDAKYGFRDYRGGGRSSGRETLGRVAAGAIALELLKSLGIEVCAYTKSIGSVSCQKNDYSYFINTGKSACRDRITASDLESLRKQKFDSPIYMPDTDASQNAETLLLETMEQQDSLGGTIECIVSGLPAGLGEPVFDKLDADLAKAMFSIGAVKGFEIGSGFQAALAKGSENNDSFVALDDTVRKTTNHAGGILGGISDGSDLILRVAIKPTPSIFRTQHTVKTDLSETDIQIKGRHDPVIVPRAVVVAEAMTAITVADALLANTGATMDHLKKIYS